jgi:hypothetical protein
MNALPLPDAHRNDLPAVLAGPLLRRLEARRLVLWLVASRPLEARLQLAWDDAQRGLVELDLPLGDSCCQRLAVGRHAWLHLIDVRLDETLPVDTFIYYDLHIEEEDGGTRAIADWAPHLLYPGQARPGFVRRGRLDHLLHGSCRKPHHPSKDGLLQADALLAATRSQPAERPALLMLSGDQVYADDVAGPMLVAVHRLTERLGLYGEHLDGATVSTSEALYAHPAGYYRREDLLPAYTANEELRERFFGGVKKPVFTSANAHNHLVTFAEVLAMYLLVWSPTPWQLIAPRLPELPEHLATRYRAEEPLIRAFVADLPQAARALAQLPCLMIFDDHDITDDWNLSARWEQSAYGHPFSRRIVGNALLGYLLCQGWGNCPETFAGELPTIRELLATPDRQQRLSAEAQDAVIDRLLVFDHWHYSLPGQPLLLVLDTRTRRWRSESYLSRPSGLMDWEALCELQHALLDEPAVVIVSPAPMFGVKLIEIVQRLFTWAGYPLLVDAENWMAHRGAAKVMLNIFRHSRTPANYVILSGDVHYSFAYEVHIRHRDSGPRIWQITSSGIKNEFPRRLLDWFDRLNRWLYAPHSLLNWFTKRRRMQITPRIPSRSQRGERLWNGAGLGQVRLDEQGRPCEIRQLNADGAEPTCFEAIARQEMDG